MTRRRQIIQTPRIGDVADGSDHFVDATKMVELGCEASLSARYKMSAPPTIRCRAGESDIHSYNIRPLRVRCAPRNPGTAEILGLFRLVGAGA